MGLISRIYSRTIIGYIQIKATFSSKIYGSSMVVLVPVPESTAKANILVTLGKAKYDATKKALVSVGLCPWLLSALIHRCFSSNDPHGRGFIDVGVEDLKVHRGSRALFESRSHSSGHDKGEEALGSTAHLDAIPGVVDWGKQSWNVHQ